jgi:hypothetical protein
LHATINLVEEEGKTQHTRLIVTDKIQIKLFGFNFASKQGSEFCWGGQFEVDPVNGFLVIVGRHLSHACT